MAGDARISRTTVLSMIKEYSSSRVLQIDAICFYSTIVGKTADDGSHYCD
jgi:hypothetical protein